MMAVKVNKRSIFIYGFSLSVILIIIYKTLPVIRFFYYGFSFLFVLFGLLITLLHFRFIEQKLSIIGIGITLLGILLMTIVPFITSSAIFYSNQYQNLIGEIKESEFEKDISPIDINEIRLVDEAMASRLGDKKLGEEPALGSQAQLGRFNIQKVNGKLYWVAPLLHRNIWKWISNREGTPGYVMVSASNPQDVRLVKNADGKPIHIKYQPKAYFHEYLRRHLYFNGYMTKGLTDFTFEVNETGKPFWVVTLFEKEIGYKGNDAKGVVIVDAQNGEISQYSIEEAPLWVDRIQPEDFIYTQMDHWGRYVKGWFNSFLAEEGVLRPTPEMSLVYGNNDEAYWYTGITSSGADESTIGFVLINTRTKEAKFYKQSGATEYAAMDSAEGKVQEKNYQATFPIMYNILGVPTYVSSLKDKAGLVKLIAMVSVEDYSLLGIGETKQEALRAYQNSLRNLGNRINIDADVEEKEMTGTVLRLQTDIREGNSYYYLILEGQEDRIFIGTSSISVELPLTQVGDRVKITFLEGTSPIIDMSTFDNLSL